MSSRSLAAARAKRAGESAPPVSGTRPGTSIGSHAAFAPPAPPGYQQPPPNVRAGRGPPANQPGKQPMQQQQQMQQQQKPAQSASNGVPFTKLSISDAIGLITLRLGKIEQWVYEAEHEGIMNGGGHSSEGSNIPDNSRVIDLSVLTSIINRLDSLEKNAPGGATNEETSNLSAEVTKLTEQVARFSDEGTRHNLAIAKHAEQIFKFDRDLVETKDLLKTFMLKYDSFVSETNDRFGDFELALTEVEKTVHASGEPSDPVVAETEGEIESADLKSIVKRELAAGGNLD
jgi:uncharacterized protein YkuJ